MTIITGEEGLRQRRTGRRSSARRKRAASASRSWRTRRSVSPACTAAPHDSAPGLQGRRRYIKISNAPSGVPPRMRALVVWKPPQSRAQTTPLPRAQSRCAVHSNMCPLSHSPAPLSLTCPRMRHACAQSYSPPRVRLTLVHRPPVPAPMHIHLYHHGQRLSSLIRRRERLRRSCRCSPERVAERAAETEAAAGEAWGDGDGW